MTTTYTTAADTTDTTAPERNNTMSTTDTDTAPTAPAGVWSDAYGPATLTAADGRSRVVMAPDYDPHPPECDFACPVIRIDPRGYGGSTATATGYGADSAAHDGTGVDVAGELHRLAREYGWQTAVTIVDRWLRVFHGGSLITKDTRGNGGGDYVFAAYDTRDMRAAWGQVGEDLEQSRPDFGEWLAYAAGDTWALRLERREFVPACGHCDRPECGEEVWSVVTSVTGYYGEEWARESAEDVLTD